MDADFLIVGAGLAGAATAYHLTRRGARGVVVLEKEETAGTHSSGRSAALVRGHIDDPDVARLTRESVAVLREGRLADYAGNGSLLLGLGDDQARDYWPMVSGRGLWCPDDGIIEVAALLESYLRGQEVRYCTELTSWKQRGDGMLVRTNRGELTARVLINAAGPWAGRVGGIEVIPRQRHLFITPPMDSIEPGRPFVWDVVNGLYFRPESGGLLLSACDETPAEPGDYAEDPAVLDELAEKVLRLQPALGSVSIMRQWVGQRVFAPDDKFVIGYDPQCEKLFHVAGLGGHGVTASWAVGRLAADLLLQGPTDTLNPFGPARFSSGSA